MTGEAVITGAGRLPAKYVIHTVWDLGREEAWVRQKRSLSCYKTHSGLQLRIVAGQLPFQTSVPGLRLSKEAAEIAFRSVTDFLSQSADIDKIIFVCFDEENEYLMRQQLKNSSN